MDVNQFLEKNTLAGTDGVIPMESHVNSVIGLEPGEVVSDEGFSDIFKGFWNWLIEPGKPGEHTMTGGWSKKREVIIAAMKRTYLDEKWLANRVIKGGVLRLDHSYDFIGIQGQIKTRDFDDACQDFLDKTRKVMEAYGRYLQLVDMELQSILRKITVDVEDINAFHVEDLQERLEASKVQLVVSYRTIFGNTYVSRIVTPAVDSDKPFAAEKLKEYTLPALTAEEVVLCCNGILKISEGLDIMAEIRRDFAHLKGFRAIDNMCSEISNWVEEQRSTARANSQSGVPVIEPDLDHQESMLELLNSVHEIPARMIGFHSKQVDALIRAYARLIDRSVK